MIVSFLDFINDFYLSIYVKWDLISWQWRLGQNLFWYCLNSVPQKQQIDPFQCVITITQHWNIDGEMQIKQVSVGPDWRGILGASFYANIRKQENGDVWHICR